MAQRADRRAAAHEAGLDLQLRNDGDDSFQALQEAAWAHIGAERFEEAEGVLRKLIEKIDLEDADRRWHYLGLMAGVLNSLDRADEGTEMYRRALVEARRIKHPSIVGTARYMMANQYLIFGDPEDALTEATPVPPGAGHVQCLLHAVAAEALWKLERRDEARTFARNAIAACPTDDRRAQLSEQLGYILTTG